MQQMSRSDADAVKRSRRFSVAPMIDWTDIPKSDVYSEA
jgi:hypothetical protein